MRRDVTYFFLVLSYPQARRNSDALYVSDSPRKGLRSHDQDVSAQQALLRDDGVLDAVLPGEKQTRPS